MHVKSLLLIALVLPGWAFSADLVVSGTVGDLSQIQSETILYEAKAKRAKAKGDMQEQLVKAGDDQSLAQSSTSPSVVSSDLPTALGSSGIVGHFSATFIYPDGNKATAKVGQQIPGGFVVTEVGIDRVEIAKGNRRFLLKFGAATPSSAATNNFMQSPPLGTSVPGSMAPPFLQH